MKKKMISAVEWLFGLVGVVMIPVETYAVLARNVLLISTPGWTSCSNCCLSGAFSSAPPPRIYVG